MFVGVAELVVMIPQSGSLKAKRAVINAMKGRIKARHTVAVAEIGGIDLWQRSVLGVSVVGSDPGPLEDVLRAVARTADGVKDGEVVEFHFEVVPWTFSDDSLG